jgi:nucleoid-associated protein YgaU
MRWTITLLTVTCVLLSPAAFAVQQLIATQTITVPSSDYVLSDNAPCPTGGKFNFNDLNAAATVAGIASAATGFPVGVLLPLGMVLVGDAAKNPSVVSQWIVPAEARHSTCASLAIRVPAGARDVTVKVYAAEAGGPLRECTQVDGTFLKCPTGWNAWSYTRKGDLIVALAKNWSHNRTRVMKIEIWGEVWQSSHIVTKGESLWTIAKSVYGNADFWLKLYKANDQELRGDPVILLPGIVLVVPPPKS